MRDMSVLIRQQMIKDTCLGLFNTIRRFGINAEIYHYQQLRNYWQDKLNATDEDIFYSKFNARK
jgi:hypothetical protein